MRGFFAILTKECSHIRRDPSTILFAFLVPLAQLVIYGYAIDVTVKNIPLVVFDLDGRQESRRLVDALQNTQTFRVVDRVYSAEAYRRAITSGHAKVGVLIPADYSDRLVRREQAQVQALIDGSDSQMATTALNTVNLLASRLSMSRAKQVGESLQVVPARGATGELALPIEVRPRLLFNPDFRSERFFVPGLVGIILQLVLLFLTSFSIVREREQGTLEQLFVTPVSRTGLLIGKLTPYVLMSFAELLIVLAAMVLVFDVPIAGSLSVLLLLSLLFIVTVLGLGLFISTIAATQLQAVQFAFLVMLPSVLLSGFIFPRAEMPLPIYWFSFLLPVTYYVEILRGMILRGADAIDVFEHILGLTVCCVVILSLSLARFRKQLD